MGGARQHGERVFRRQDGHVSPLTAIGHPVIGIAIRPRPSSAHCREVSLVQTREHLRVADLAQPGHARVEHIEEVDAIHASLPRPAGTRPVAVLCASVEPRSVGLHSRVAEPRVDLHVVSAAQLHEVRPGVHPEVAAPGHHVHQALGHPGLNVEAHRAGKRHRIDHAQGDEYRPATLAAHALGHCAHAPDEAGHRRDLFVGRVAAPRHGPEETRVAEVIHLDAVHIVVDADLFEDAQHLVTHGLVAVVHLRPRAMRSGFVYRAHQTLGVLLLPGGNQPDVPRVVPVVHALGPEDLDVVFPAPVDHHLQRVGPLLDQRAGDVVLVAPLRAGEDLRDLGAMGVARERAPVRAVEDRIHLRVFETDGAGLEHALGSGLPRLHHRVPAIVVEYDAARPIEHLGALALERVGILRLGSHRGHQQHRQRDGNHVANQPAHFVPHPWAESEVRPLSRWTLERPSPPRWRKQEERPRRGRRYLGNRTPHSRVEVTR